jgi:S-layer homology domain
LRLSVVALALAILSGLGLMQPAPVAAADDPKVVLIVGPTEGSTDKYRKSADAAYAEAIKHTSNVVKVYSPNATWSKVKAAVAGASIVVYLGHGNGWPSPYTYDPAYKTKNGFGLNSSAGNGDSNNKYYGEPYVSTLDLAPNAVIILNRLCYASGNSEPGDSAPSQTTARKRVDNYGAGFLAAGAGAVIADGHSGAAAYIRNLFTMDGSVLDVWRANPNYHDHEKAFASTRTPGATAYTDTENADSGYYRSLVTQPEPYPGTPFTDIAASSFADDIVWLFDSGITSGCSDARYCPNGSVSRGQMASFLARALDLPAASKDYFSDDDGNSHESNINKVREAGITSGCGTGKYCPTALVSRAQMASFLAKALALPSADGDTFTDDDGLVHEPNIERIAAATLTSGCSATKYCPTTSVTRGQMAAFLHRAFGD